MAKASFFQRFFGNIPIGEKSKGLGIFTAFFKRLVHAFARYMPLLPSWRASLHRLRGVRVGRNTFIGTEVFIDDADPALVTIEDEVTIIGQSTILGHAYYPKHFAGILDAASKREGTVIRKGAYLGLRSTVLAGVEVGEYAIVAAGSLVNKDVPAYTVVAGVPAKIIRTFERSQLQLERE